MTTTNRLVAANHALDAHRDAVRDFDQSPEAAIIDLLASLRQLCEAEGLEFSDCVRASLMHHKQLTA